MDSPRPLASHSTPRRRAAPRRRRRRACSYHHRLWLLPALSLVAGVLAWVCYPSVASCTFRLQQPLGELDFRERFGVVAGAAVALARRNET